MSVSIAEPDSLEQPSSSNDLILKWTTWCPEPTADPYVHSVYEKLQSDSHTDLRKCVIKPSLSRAFATNNSNYTDAKQSGFWLLPPRRAPEECDVRLFSCTTRCESAGTFFVLPEHNIGYPAARGSMVLVKKGQVYGVGVLRTDVYDEHVKEGKACCSSDLVLLRSVKRDEDNDSRSAESQAEEELQQALSGLTVGPAELLKAFAGKGKPSTKGSKAPSAHITSKISSSTILNMKNKPLKTPANFQTKK